MKKKKKKKKKSKKTPRFIINVSSPEGVFNTSFKSSAHPHTNMAKAALNQLTLTCSSELAASEIYMNSVDTGWVSKMSPTPLQSTTRKTPLDEEDGAARILDPIFSIVNSNIFNYPFGVFFQNFMKSDW